MVSLFVLQRANKCVPGTMLRGLLAFLISFYPYSGNYLILLLRKWMFREVVTISKWPSWDANPGF